MEMRRYRTIATSAWALAIALVVGACGGGSPTAVAPTQGAAQTGAQATATQAPATAQPTWKPERAVELVVQSAPGGGTDTTARLIQKIWQTSKMVDASVSVNNQAGGGGNVALAYVSQKTGDAHTLSLGAATVLTTQIAGNSDFNYADFTPLAVLNSEFLVFAVRTDSPIKTAKDLIEKLGKDPASLSIAIGTGVGGVNHVAAAQVAKAGGADPKKLKVVVFKSSQESVTNLLGGHVDLVVSSASVVLPFAGQVRMIALTAPKRMPGGLAEVPTFKEQGLDLVLDNFRYAFGPPKLTAAQVTYWDGIFGKLRASDEWKKELDNNVWAGNELKAADVGPYLKSQYDLLKAALGELGFAKK